MAIWTKPRVMWDGNNISTSVRAAAPAFGTEGVDDSAGGHKARSSQTGLKTAALSLELNWLAGSTTSIDSLFGSTGKFGVGLTGAVLIRPTTAAIAVGNPEYGFTARVASYEFGGAIGSQNVATVDLQNAGANITRATT